MNEVGAEPCPADGSDAGRGDEEEEDRLVPHTVVCDGQAIIVKMYVGKRRRAAQRHGDAKQLIIRYCDAIANIKL